MKIACKNPTDVVKRAFWLAYESSKVTGMGRLRATQDATEESVWANIQDHGDYPEHAYPRLGTAYADYVFGRMMKLSFDWGKDYVEFSDAPIREDYQSWCWKYPTNEVLVTQAIKEISHDSGSSVGEEGGERRTEPADGTADVQCATGEGSPNDKGGRRNEVGDEDPKPGKPKRRVDKGPLPRAQEG